MKLDVFEEAVGVERLRRYEEELGSPYVLTAVGAKGPSFLMEKGSPVAVWTDRKTPGYPNKAIRGKLVLGGGNWKDSGETPLGVYMRERAEEIKAEGRIISKAVFPHGRYFTALPREAVGNDRLAYPYCDFTSIFAAEVDLAELYDELRMPRRERGGSLMDRLEWLMDRLNMGLSTESGQVITRMSDFRNGTHVRFGWGDDFKLRNILEERYGIRTAMEFVDGVLVIKLDSSPDEPYEKSRGLFARHLRPDNNPQLKGSVEEGKVFEARSE